MLYFVADARDGGEKSGCNVCCCEQFSVRPGETNKISVNYAPWAAFVAEKGLSCGTEFEFSPCLNCNGTRNGFSDNVFNRTAVNTELDASLASALTESESDIYTYSVTGMYGPQHGSIAYLSADTGDFTYRPDTSYTGYDRFYFTITDSEGNSETREYVIAVDRDASDSRPYPQPEWTAPVTIDRRRVKVDREGLALSFPIEVAPNANVGDIYRLTVRQPAIDCDCGTYWHVSCYDIRIGKCG